MKGLIKYIVLFTLVTQLQKVCAKTFNIKQNHDSLVYLEIRGKIIIKEKSENNIYKVELIEDNKVIDSVFSTDNRLFVFGLLKNKYYALKVYKAGYLPKLIMVDTYIPDDKYLEDYFIFDFKTELVNISEEVNLDSDTKDFPIAIVQFDSAKKGFNYNQEYSQNIKMHLYNKY